MFITIKPSVADGDITLEELLKEVAKRHGAPAQSGQSGTPNDPNATPDTRSVPPRPAGPVGILGDRKYSGGLTE